MSSLTPIERCLGLHVVYDGSHFQGYQVQPGQRTVQAVLEQALQTLLGHPCQTICAGRTDAGVHARAQFIHVYTSSAFPVDKLAAALRRQLPDDLRVLQAYVLPHDFHARFSALSRRYRYILRAESTPEPFAGRYCWHYPYALDLEKLRRVWAVLPGRHNFEAFCKRGSYRTHYEIDIQSARVLVRDRCLIVLEIEAQSFLYNMVRTLVGTSLDIVRGRFPEEHLTRLLTEPQRRATGLTAPPQGLFLWDVRYPERFGLNLAAQAERCLSPQVFDGDI
jgi:tRNA pseudouridine38-40 synthase